MVRIKDKMQRNQSLDALRGIAILGMVLSGSIAFGGLLPGWMYHAQVPPPLHKFNANLPGVTWVDLVFPFFLFAMGAALPLSLKKHIEAKKSIWFIIGLAAKRFALLAFFALFTQHMKAWVIAEHPNWKEHILSIFAFVLLCFQFIKASTTVTKIIKIFSFAIGIVLLFILPFWKGKGFDFYKSDIILMVLANMAFFGTVIYCATYNNKLLRIGILAFVAAVFFAGTQTGDNWVKAIFEWKNIGKLNIDWLYKFYFLKYLFIVLPGTIAGEWMMRNNDSLKLSTEAKNIILLSSVGLIVGNLFGLFVRIEFGNFLFTLLYCSVAYFVVVKKTQHTQLSNFVKAGTFMLILGLIIEPYQGGIKKDSSTYSYYFVTSGLAFFMLIVFQIFTNKVSKTITSFLATIGKNPMVAYVAGALIVTPLLELTYTKQYWDAMQQNQFMGLMKGVIYTALVSLITILFVRKKWFWKS